MDALLSASWSKRESTCKPKTGRGLINDYTREKFESFSTILTVANLPSINIQCGSDDASSENQIV